MPSPIIENMLAKTGLPRLTEATFIEFTRSAPKAVVFFSESPQKYPESNDVAMVLPEIIKEFPDIAGAIAAAESEHQLQKRFDFTVWPALAFFKEGQYVGAITGIQNWDDYLAEIAKLMSKEVGNAIPAINL